jgi:uncharacterized membrane protein
MTYAIVFFTGFLLSSFIGVYLTEPRRKRRDGETYKDLDKMDS